MNLERFDKNKLILFRRLKSFKYAFSGIIYLFKTEHNFNLHISLTILAIILGFILKISLSEWCCIVISIGFVLAAEAFNTALELLTDLVSPNYNKKAKIIKDVSAAAVLFTALTSLIIGFIVFLPKFWSLI